MFFYCALHISLFFWLFPSVNYIFLPLFSVIILSVLLLSSIYFSVFLNVLLRALHTFPSFSWIYILFVLLTVLLLSSIYSSVFFNVLYSTFFSVLLLRPPYFSNSSTYWFYWSVLLFFLLFFFYLLFGLSVFCCGLHPYHFFQRPTYFLILLLCYKYFLFLLLCSTTYIIILHFLPFSSVLHVHEGIYRVSVIAESYFRQSAKLAKLFTHLTQVFLSSWQYAGRERDSKEIFIWR